MKHATAMFAAAAVIGLVLAGCTSPAQERIEPHTAILAHARTVATTVDTAEEAWALGYRPDPACVPGMGVHWIHKPGQPDSHFDAVLDEDHPEVVLFQPSTANFSDLSNQTFVGIEYVVATEGTSMNTTATVPRLRGVPLVGPMPGHFPGMPYHAELHIFLIPGHESGPSFPQTSAAVTCPESAGTE